MTMRLKGGGQTNLRGISRKDRPNVDVTYNHVNELVSGSFSTRNSGGRGLNNAATRHRYRSVPSESSLA